MAKRPDILVRFGNRLRKLRNVRGKTQEGFAFDCGLDRTYISGIERGKRNVSLKNIEVLAKSLKISVSDLLKGV